MCHMRPVDIYVLHVVHVLHVSKGSVMSSQQQNERPRYGRKDDDREPGQRTSHAENHYERRRLVHASGPVEPRSSLLETVSGNYGHALECA